MLILAAIDHAVQPHSRDWQFCLDNMNQVLSQIITLGRKHRNHANNCNCQDFDWPFWLKLGPVKVWKAPQLLERNYRLFACYYCILLQITILSWLITYPVTAWHAGCTFPINKQHKELSALHFPAVFPILQCQMFHCFLLSDYKINSVEHAR